MIFKENVSLAPFTTLRVGGAAEFFATCETEEDVEAALALGRGVSFFVLGGGSNILVPDEGVAGLVVKIAIGGTSFEERDNEVFVVAGAGIPWDELVKEAAARGLWGIENLAGIPGTVGGAPIQNIGAYGAELSDVFILADTIDLTTGRRRRIGARATEFGYRDSVFKKERNLVITWVALRLTHTPTPRLAYRDLALAVEGGESLTTPAEIGNTVRRIRSSKFPDLAREGTAGSFFKNPVVSRELAETLARKFIGLPAFPQPDGHVKLSLAWLLDRVLSLKGFSMGRARLFEHQPLVIVASEGASAREIDSLAREVEERVKKVVGITLVREVETFGVPH